jgi:peptidoglycan hydrolase-like protein with peptidoglycan-binding domain
MDVWVQNSQIWLNNNYHAVPGYNLVDEDGLTGWGTVNGITRALQHELGISALTDTFGPTTLSSLTSQVGSVSTTTTKPRIVGLMQCGLWCKGYSGGTVFDSWTLSPELNTSVPGVRSAMGLGTTNSLPPKAFKSLLTMDAYSLLSGGTSAAQGVQRWLNGTYYTRADYFIIPCDGVYSRDVQRGLMLAIQYELGMADGVANGNFGPATQSGLQTYGAFGLGATDTTRKLVRLFKGALIFNGYDVPLSGTFDATTASQTSAFQAFVGLPVTGAANYQTWASLLVSTGDPNRPATAADTSTPLTTAKAGSLWSAGYRTIGRYLNVESKRYQPGELGVIFGAGLTTFPIYQEFNDSSDDFTYFKGYNQGVAAVRRARQLGFVANTVIHFAVDYDATNDDITAVIIPFFQGIRDGVATSTSVSYRVGIYGTRNVCARVSAAGLAVSSFTAGMSTGYSGNLGFPLPANWSYDQIRNYSIGSGSGALEIDKDVKSSSAPSVGSSGVLATPSRTVGGVLQFDEFFWWLTELCHKAEKAAINSAGESIAATSDLYDFVLQVAKAPTYAASPWTIYTPPSERRPGFPAPLIDDFTFARSAFEADAAASPLPIGVAYPDPRHWAATAVGYNAWGAVTNSFDVWPGDLGGWSIDLVTLWKQYAQERHDGVAAAVAGCTPWVMDKLGASNPADSVLSMADLIADMDGYLTETMRAADSSRSVADVMREILVRTQSDPGWRFDQFFAQRFGGSATTMRQAANNAFTSTAVWTTIPASAFLDGVRRPGETPASPSSTDPGSTELAAELDDFTQAFVARFSQLKDNA